MRGKISSLDYYLAKDEEIELNPQQVQEANNSAVTYARHCAVEALMSVSGFTFRSNFDTQDESDKYDSSYETYYTMCQQKLLSGGYTVYTSIDTALQQQLQDSVDNTLKGYTAISDNGVYAMQAAATSIDNVTGNDSCNCRFKKSGFNKRLYVKQGISECKTAGKCNQTIMVYMPYLQMGNNPDSIVTDESIEGGPVKQTAYMQEI